MFCGALVFAAKPAGANARANSRSSCQDFRYRFVWDKVEAIRYTWNGEITGLFKTAHKWEWEPKTGKISYEGPDKEGKPVKVSYDSSQLGSQSDQVKNEVEPAFVNDNYWPLFPFHAYWDTSASAIDEGISLNCRWAPASATLIPVKYPAEVGGYTPGDTWELYVGKDNRVVYFVFHRGGTKQPSRVLRNLGRLQEGRSYPVLNRASRDRRWQAPAHFDFGRGGEGGGIGQVDGRAINNRQAESDYFTNQIPGDYDSGAGTAQFWQIAICGHADLQRRALASNDWAVRVRLLTVRLASVVFQHIHRGMPPETRKAGTRQEGCGLG